MSLALLLLLPGIAFAQAEPEGRAAFITASLAYHDNRFDDCITGYQKTIALHHEVPFSKMMISRCLGLRGDLEAAMDALDEAAEFEFAGVQVLQTDPDFLQERTHARFEEILAKVRANADPCASRKRRRLFDFWVGEWNVVRLNGQIAGIDTVELAENGCLLRETWAGNGQGNTGASTTYYDKWTGYWRQLWIDPSGVLQDFSGDFEGDALVMRRLVYNGGTKNSFRLTYAPLPDGGVRQLTERSLDDGPWVTTSDLKFVRR